MGAYAHAQSRRPLPSACMLQSIVIGGLIQCYVVSTGKSGCFVRLAGGVSGRVMLKLLSDRYVPNPAKEFPPGRLVAGKVLSKVCVPWGGGGDVTVLMKSLQ